MSITIEGILRKLTIEQKLAQLSGLSVTDLLAASLDERFEIDPSRLPSIRPHGVGHLSLAWFAGNDDDSLRTNLTRIQDAVRELTPFGIGALVHFEAINGLVHHTAPQFPTAWAQAGTWNPELVRQAADVSGRKMAELGVHLAFSPVMDLARDPRWGRVHETYGEDRELVAQMSVAFVQGIHGGDEPLRAFATGKHFLGYGASEGGLNQAATQLGRRALVDEYAEPFRRAIREAKLNLVMNSYNEIDGIPAAADPWVFRELLRGKLGFEGLVVSDYDSIDLLKSVYHTASTDAEAAAQALRAGIEADLPGGNCFSALTTAFDDGLLDEAVVDEALTHTLRLKQKLGLITGFSALTYSRPKKDTTNEDQLRGTIADQAIVLLGNGGALPLAPEARIVVTGPGAHELRLHFGAYTSASSIEMQLGSKALLDGKIPGIDPTDFSFTDIFQARMPGIEPMFEDATRQIHPNALTPWDALKARFPNAEYLPLGDLSDADADLGLATARKRVEAADAVVAIVGERTGWVGNNTAGEGQSTSEPRLPGNQEALIRALAATGTPVISVIVSGRPLLLEQVAKYSAAVLLAPLLGEEGGRAIGDVLVGTVNPSGKLPSTFPRNAGQIPMYHGHKFGSGYDHPTGIRHGYNDVASQTPLYAFGHGLSYTTFDLQLNRAAAGTESLEAEVVITNTGNRDGIATVQLYARDEEATVVRPVRQLIAFTRVRLTAGESQSVTLNAPMTRLFYTLPDGRRGLEAGRVTLLGGFASDDLRFETAVNVGTTFEK